MPTSSLISEHIEAIMKAIRVAFAKQVDVQSDGTAFEKVAPVVSAMVCSVADFIIDAAKTGGTPSATSVGVFLINRATGFSGLSKSHQVLCVAALVELATTSVAEAPVLAAAVAGVAGSAGLASPVGIPLMMVSSASFIVAALKVNQQCGPLVVEKISNLNDEAFSIYLQFSQYISTPTP